MWRLRSFISFLVLLFFWLAVYSGRTTFAGYEKSQMLTYVIGIAFLRDFIFASRTEELAAWIRDGNLNTILIRPLSLAKFLLTRDFADKLLNLLFVVVEIFLVAKIFSIKILTPNLINFLIFWFSVALSFFLYFFINVIISMTAFWTDDIWAVRFLFGVIFLQFFSGALVPLDVLPGTFQKVLSFTPFPYLIYFPIKIWLGQITFQEAGKTLLICFLWTLFCFWLAKKIWLKGSRTYGAYGG